MRSLIAAAASLLPVVVCLCGCAGVPVFSKPGATQADYNRDSYACDRDVRQSFVGQTGVVASIDAQDFGERCMIAKGWTIARRQ